MDESNPYEAPGEAVMTSFADGQTNPRGGAFVYIAWVFVFAINMAVPLLFGTAMTGDHGRLGMSVAMVSLFVLGCTIFAANRNLARALLAGGAVVALSQLFPILQIVAGVIGLGVGQALGHATPDSDEGPARVTSDFGGFVITFVTGGILMAVSFCAGGLLQILRRFLHRRQ